MATRKRHLLYHLVVLAVLGAVNTTSAPVAFSFHLPVWRCSAQLSHSCGLRSSTTALFSAPRRRRRDAILFASKNNGGQGNMKKLLSDPAVVRVLQVLVEHVCLPLLRRRTGRGGFEWILRDVVRTMSRIRRSCKR